METESRKRKENKNGAGKLRNPTQTQLWVRDMERKEGFSDVFFLCAVLPLIYVGSFSLSCEMS